MSRIEKKVVGSGTQQFGNAAPRSAVTLGDLRELVAACGSLPDNYHVIVSTPEIDAESPMAGEVALIEGATSDGPGTVMLTLFQLP